MLTAARPSHQNVQDVIVDFRMVHATIVVMRPGRPFDEKQRWLELGIPGAKVRQMLPEGMVLWTYFPKGTSGIQSDLSRDKGWDAIESGRNLRSLSLP